MEFEKNIKILRLELTSFAVMKREKDQMHLIFQVNGISFKADKKYQTEDELFDSFFLGKEILAEKYFEPFIWSGAKTNKCNIKLENKWVTIKVQ